jgi:hypothetical protein
MAPDSEAVFANVRSHARAINRGAETVLEPPQIFTHGPTGLSQRDDRVHGQLSWSVRDTAAASGYPLDANAALAKLLAAQANVGSRAIPPYGDQVAVLAQENGDPRAMDIPHLVSQPALQIQRLIESDMADQIEIKWQRSGPHVVTAP